MQTTILLCRHAEVYNPDRILYGRLPGYGLSPEGLKQAARLSGFLAGVRLAAAVTSPMLRARQTAQQVMRFHEQVPLRVSERLNEVFTSWQGKAWSQLNGARYYEPPADPGDETMVEVAGRMRKFVEYAVNRYPGGNVLAVSHGDPIAIFLMALHGHRLSEEDLRRNRTFYPELTSINRLVFDEDAKLTEREYIGPRSQTEAVTL